MCTKNARLDDAVFVLLFRRLWVESTETAPLLVVKFLRALFRASTLAGLGRWVSSGPVVSNTNGCVENKSLNEGCSVQTFFLY
jgi:hypothetical protein